MSNGFGTITWWGFSPAIDLQNPDLITALTGLNIDEKDDEEMRILLVGAGDLRHALTTLARSYRYRKKKFHFYILENALELYARDMLFLSLSLETPKRMGLQEKTEMFLELFGNLTIRKQASEYVEKMANEFIKDMRQRQYLGPRYDCRMNAYDWDYHMKLVNKEAEIIHKHEYKTWRSTGIAFEPREATYDVPNKTLASGVVVNQGGEKVSRRGYWGDIVASPFLAFGIQSEDKSFFKKSNNMYTKLSLNVAEFNILSLFHELTHKEKYVPPKVEEKSSEKKEKEGGATITEITEEEENQEEESLKQDDISKSLPLEDVKITFLPLNCLPDLQRKSKYQNTFHMVYFANSLVHLLTSDVAPILTDTAVVIIETARYMLELKDDQEVEFVNKVIGLAKAAGCQDPGKIDAKTSNFITFRYQRPSS
uniref:UPF0470 protein C19orf51-like protein n=1 Tax=Magallana gigas TaxID=29159 RepID=K1Q0Z4_MAGGI